MKADVAVTREYNEHNPLEDVVVTRKKNPRFFMVCRDPQEVKYNNPKSVLYTMDEAKKHAEQLVKDSGHTFYILTPIAMVKPSTPPVEWTVFE